MDARFRTPFTWIFAGPSKCGKTTSVGKLIRNAGDMLDRPPSQIIYYYHTWQPLFDALESGGYVDEFIQRLPTVDEVTAKAAKKEREMKGLGLEHGGTLMVIDDFGNQVNNDIVELFTVASHHHSLSVCFLVQTLYSKNPLLRTLTQNSSYMSVYKNPRDSTSIATFARQFKPGNSDYVIKAAQKILEKPYSYVLFDLTQPCKEKNRVKSSVFPDELPMRVWWPPKLHV